MLYVVQKLWSYFPVFNQANLIWLQREIIIQTESSFYASVSNQVDQNFLTSQFQIRWTKVLSCLDLSWLKFRFSEKPTKIWKKSHLFWGYWVNVKTSGRFFQTLWPSHNVLPLIFNFAFIYKWVNFLFGQFSFWSIFFHSLIKCQ